MEYFKNIPFDTQEADERGYEHFEDVIWHNSEVCNGCFSQVRNIGPEIWKSIESQTMYLNQWYERTDNGSQEHTPWDNNKRFGTCYCLKCGSDCNGNHRNKSLEELKPLAARILHYVCHQTEYTLNDRTFGREIRRLKGERSAQGYETEILAIAFARALEKNTSTSTQAAPVMGD